MQPARHVAPPLSCGQRIVRQPSHYHHPPPLNPHPNPNAQAPLSSHPTIASCPSLGGHPFAAPARHNQQGSHQRGAAARCEDGMGQGLAPDQALLHDREYSCNDASSCLLPSWPQNCDTPLHSLPARAPETSIANADVVPDASRRTPLGLQLGASVVLPVSRRAGLAGRDRCRRDGHRRNGGVASAGMPPGQVAPGRQRHHLVSPPPAALLQAGDGAGVGCQQGLCASCHAGLPLIGGAWPRDLPPCKPSQASKAAKRRCYLSIGLPPLCPSPLPAHPAATSHPSPTPPSRRGCPSAEHPAPSAAGAPYHPCHPCTAGGGQPRLPSQTSLASPAPALPAYLA